MLIPAAGCDEARGIKQGHAARSDNRRQICKKCQTFNGGHSTSKFCHECGHRLQKKVRLKEPSYQSREAQQPGIDSPPSASEPIVYGGWFWASNELPLIPVCGGTKEKDLNDICEHPPKYPLVNAHTANGGHSNDSEVDRRLRRVSSFGHPTFLPALPLLPSRGTCANVPAIPTTSLQKTPNNPAVEKGSSSSCGVLWGEVLAEAIAEFESKKIILSVEIDSDESCMCALAQKMQIEEAARSKYVVASGISQLRYKYNELDKKVRINKEKLTMVQLRLATLQAQHAREQQGESRAELTPDMTSQVGNAHHHPSQNNQCEIDNRPAVDEIKAKKKNSNAGKKSKKTEVDSHEGSTVRQHDELEVAATLIQKRFRVLRARRMFAEMVKRAYQRVYDPATQRYFYFNERTRSSQWEVPQTLAKANATMARKRSRRTPSARSLNNAASRIQALYRRRAARHAMRQLLLQVYEKVYDPDSGTYYYYCYKTKTSTWERPKLQRDEDVPTRVDEPVTRHGSCSAEDAAATKIQTLFRNRATRQFIRDLAKGNIEKHFDADAQSWYYFNTRTQQSFWEQARHASLSTAVRPT